MPRSFICNNLIACAIRSISADGTPGLKWGHCTYLRRIAVDFGLPWFAWIVIVGIVCGCVTNMVIARSRSEADGELRLQLEQNVELNRQLLVRLESLDNRMAGVEKTLSDVPN